MIKINKLMNWINNAQHVGIFAHVISQGIPPNLIPFIVSIY